MTESVFRGESNSDGVLLSEAGLRRFRADALWTDALIRVGQNPELSPEEFRQYLEGAAYAGSYSIPYLRKIINTDYYDALEGRAYFDFSTVAKARVIMTCGGFLGDVN